MFSTLIFAGHAGKDAEMRYIPSGQAVTSFPVAVNRSYTGADGQKVSETTWLRVTAWGKLAEVCNTYVKKGMKVLVEGRLIPDKETGGPRVWQKSDGTSAASFEVNASTVRFLSSAGNGSHDGQMEVEPIPAEDFGTEDNLPF